MYKIRKSEQIYFQSTKTTKPRNLIHHFYITQKAKHKNNTQANHQTSQLHNQEKRKNEKKKKGYLFVDLNADSALGDVPDATGTAVVELVGHTLVNGAVNLDVDIFTDLEGPEVSGEGNVTLLPEGPSEQISGTRTKTVTSRHFFSISLSL